LRVSAEVDALTSASAISCMPRTPSLRAFSPRALMLARAESGGAISGPNSDRLRTSRGCETARCWATMVPMEWPSTWARLTFSRAQIDCTASTSVSMLSAAPAAPERPLPGRSGRITR
jgi:hypothetical protein